PISHSAAASFLAAAARREPANAAGSLSAGESTGVAGGVVSGLGAIATGGMEPVISAAGAALAVVCGMGAATVGGCVGISAGKLVGATVMLLDNPVMLVASGNAAERRPIGLS